MTRPQAPSPIRPLAGSLVLGLAVLFGQSAGAAANAQGLSFQGPDADLAPPVEEGIELDLDYGAEHGAWTTTCVAGEEPDADRCIIATPDGLGDVRLGFVVLEDTDGTLVSQFRLGIAEGAIDPEGPIIMVIDDGAPITLTDGFRVVVPPLAVIGDVERLAQIGQAMGAPGAETLAITVPRVEAEPVGTDLPLDGFTDAVGALFTHIRAIAEDGATDSDAN